MNNEDHVFDPLANGGFLVVNNKKYYNYWFDQVQKVTTLAYKVKYDMFNYQTIQMGDFVIRGYRHFNVLIDDNAEAELTATEMAKRCRKVPHSLEEMCKYKLMNMTWQKVISKDITFDNLTQYIYSMLKSVSPTYKNKRLGLIDLHEASYCKIVFCGNAGNICDEFKTPWTHYLNEISEGILGDTTWMDCCKCIIDDHHRNCTGTVDTTMVNMFCSEDCALRIGLVWDWENLSFKEFDSVVRSHYDFKKSQYHLVEQMDCNIRIIVMDILMPYLVPSFYKIIHKFDYSIRSKATGVKQDFPTILTEEVLDLKMNIETARHTGKNPDIILTHRPNIYYNNISWKECRDLQRLYKPKLAKTVIDKLMKYKKVWSHETFKKIVTTARRLIFDLESVDWYELLYQDVSHKTDIVEELKHNPNMTNVD